VTDPLSRVRAGLARDAEIARAAAASEDIYGRRDSGDCPDWLVLEFDCEGLSVWNARRHKSEGSFGHETDLTRHMSLHDPARVLRQVEKLGELVEEAKFVLGKNDPGLTDAGTLAESVLELLASIYPEDSTKTGDGS
jgi:DNA topoisomerase IB